MKKIERIIYSQQNTLVSCNKIFMEYSISAQNMHMRYIFYAFGYFAYKNQRK